MKKILIAVSVLILIILAALFFWGGGREKINDFFTENNDFGSFFDIDPQSQNDGLPTPDVATSTPIVPGTYDAPVLRQISREPVSGFTLYATSSTSTRTVIDPERGERTVEFIATSTTVRFQERATGHVYDVFEFLETPVRVSNITVQKTYQSLFTNDKNVFLALTPTFNNEQVKTTLTKIIPATPETAKASSTEQKIEENPISTAIENLTFIPGLNRIAYLLQTPFANELYTANPDRTSETKVANIPFGEMLIEPLNNTQLVVQTRASAFIPGYAYTLTLSNGNLSKIIGNVYGLLIKANSDLSYYLYSESNQGRPIIRAFNNSTDETRQIGISTIPEKCVFSTKNKDEIYCFGSTSYVPGIYPDDWYKGKVFNDEDLYRINLATGFIESIYVFEEDVSFDAINPQLSKDEGVISFQSKYDLTLWAIDLEGLDNQLD